MCESKCGSVFPNERLDPTQQHNNYTCGQESGQWSSVIMSNGEDGKKKQNETAITVYNQCGRYHTDSPSLFLFKTI